MIETDPSPEQQTKIIRQSLERALKHHKAGDLAEAGNIYQQVLQADPNQPVALHLLGLIAREQGNNDLAVELISKALAVKPDYAEAHNNLGNALKDLGKLDEAVTSYEKTLALRPDLAETHSNLGNALQDLGRWDEAVASYLKALAIKPDYAEAHSNLGNALQELGRLDDAVASYLQALAIKPDYAEAHYNLGKAFKELGRLGDTVASYQKALAIKPDYIEALNNLGVTLLSLGRLDEAMKSFLDALAVEPDLAEAHSNLGNVFKERGEMNEAMASYRKALAIKPDYTEAHSNLIFSMAYALEITTEDILEEARQWNARHAYKGEIPKHRNTPQPDRRLRVGLVSGDLRHHSVSYFLENILLEIDNNKLEIFAYATSRIEDDLTQRLKSIVANWRKVAGISDKQLADGIVADGIDILVDLSGHTAHNRLKVFTMKPAPIQIAWMGCSATTGVEAFDFVLCDKWVLPPESEVHFVEKPWRLPDAFLCFSPPDLKIDVAAPPVRTNSYITFGSFNTLTKMTGPAVSCWAEILRRVPDSRLFLKARPLDDASVQKDVLSRFSRHGVAPESLTLKGHSPDRSAHLAAYNLVDISLDPFPYAGATTSFESLWMGTPLLTLQGDRFASRVGESILHNMELGEWIGVSPQDYVEKAIAFASDSQALAVLGEGLRDRLVASSICDAPRFARSLEDAFREMWEAWCK